MDRLSDERLIEAYHLANKLSLEAQFIKLLQCELYRRNIETLLLKRDKQ